MTRHNRRAYLPLCEHACAHKVGDNVKWPGAVGAAPAVTGPLGGPMASLYVQRATRTNHPAVTP